MGFEKHVKKIIKRGGKGESAYPSAYVYLKFILKNVAH